ncbi:MAG: cytochrome c oxidase subunit II [Isosphaeraceae bacterium]|nr:cytochrome c oxidase subunit II [Isosphaeraceae bacterium]
MAWRVDAIFLALAAFSLFFTLAICFLVIFFAIKYRRGSKADRTGVSGSSALMEFIWIFVPFVIVLGLFIWAAVVFYQQYRAPADAFEVYVLGRQWMWELKHPEGKKEINELHVPLGQPVRLTMTSQDVIHSFYVPAFRIKQDVLPGRYTSLWFKPEQVGRYHLFCAEYCGTKHSGMIGSVVVMDPVDYQRWLQEGEVAESLAASGARLFRQLGCSGCHSVESSVRAPLLDGVFGHPVPLETGEIVTADERYLRDSILLPKSQVVAGYKPVMPTFEGRVGEDELLKLIAYMKSLARNERVER